MMIHKRQHTFFEFKRFLNGHRKQRFQGLDAVILFLSASLGLRKKEDDTAGSPWEFDDNIPPLVAVRHVFHIYKSKITTNHSIRH